MVTAEFQAIVMAGGKGSRMPEITVGKPKCLLPIANHPMVWYPVQMLLRAGICDILLVVLEPARAEIQLALDRSGFRAHIEIIGIPPGEDWGTADSLRFVAEKIKTDVLIVSCDLVTDFSLIEVLNIYRKNQASVTAVFFENFCETLGQTPGPKIKSKPEKDLVGIDSATSRLVFLASASDFEEMVPLTKSLLLKHQHITVHSQLLDAHLYVIRHWVVLYLIQEKSFTTVKGELLPYIVKKQLQRHAKPDADPNVSVVAVDMKKEVSQFACVDGLEHEIALMSSFNDHVGDMQSAYHGDSIRCYAYISPRESFGVRANTLHSYCLLNKKLAMEGGLWGTVAGANMPLGRRGAGADVRSRQVDDDTIVGEQCVLHDKTAIRASVLGSSCILQPCSLLASCILMDNVHVGRGCQMTNCVVCDGAVIGAGTTLTNCIVGSSHSVAQGESFSNEVLTEMDRLMEI